MKKEHEHWTEAGERIARDWLDRVIEGDPMFDKFYQRD